MPIDYKKLYESHDIILTNANPDSLVKDGTLESVDYLKNYFTQRERFKPPVDFSDLRNFARFGSAKKYYVDAFDRIYETYPYDGSLKERVEWELSSSFFDMYVFDEVYPRTNGYVLFSAKGWGTKVDSKNDYGATATASYEYVFIKGGPNTSQRSKDKVINDTSGDYKSGYANVWDPSKNRECNLKIGGIDGNTVEFWMKKSAFATTKTGREVIFDASTSEFTPSSANYGRLTIEVTGTTSASPFKITYMSGTAGFAYETIGSSVTTSSVADNKWHHYAFAFKNSGNKVEVNFYLDGKCNHTKLLGTSVGHVSGNINATIGSLLTAPSGTTVPTKGWGKLSGSLDEFRFWKDERNAAEVVRYMIEPVGGGTNTDDANTSLGVYYKFNEGITQTASIDQNILDYSGRISNGNFVGYTSAARNVGSAMVDSGLVNKEFKDPILYPFHPTVQSTLDEKKEEGRIYDFSNNGSLYHSLPAWITEEDEDKEYSPLKNLTQIVGSYFDSLAEQINSIPSLKYKSHTGFEHKPAPFNDRLLQSIGFQYFPELFSDATELEYYKSRNDRTLFEQKLFDVKNKIYHNIYNNIIYINKTKGTQKSFRNLLHCFGVGDEIYRINTYGNRVTYKLKDNYQSIPEYKKYINFGLTGSSEATVFAYSSSANPSSKAIISGTYGKNSYLGFTMESEVVFPIRHSIADTNTVVSTDSGPTRQFRTYNPYVTASLFGMHQIKPTATGNNLTWATTDSANFQVHAIKASDYSQRAKFVLAGTAGSIFAPLALSSSYIDDVFDDTRWTFSVSVSPKAHANLPSGSSGSISSAGYLVEFYGVEKVADYIKNEFYRTGSISGADGNHFLNAPKAPYIGAHRTNFSGALLHKSDGNISSTRVWYKHLPTGTIQQHNQDVKNYGTEHPYRSSYLYPTALDGIRVPEIDTLVLNWVFDTVTGSDASGQFVGADYSSGSAQKVSKYGPFGELVGKQYLPKGFNFPANSTLPINKKYVSSAKKSLPEMITSADMVNILNDDDENFNMGDLARPTNYYTSIEKSMYQTISDEMIKMFSTIKDFNNLVGEPVNKYRDDYKNMAKLRQMFYERVSNTPDLDKYVDFYKWIDLTLDSLLGYLVPMSSDMTDQYGSNIRTMVENTVLQRNKYRWKYPTLEDKTPTLEGNLLGINELLYDWEFGHAPLPYKGDKYSITFISSSLESIKVPDNNTLSFGNGTSDSPFSYTFWIRFDDWASWPSEGTMLRKNGEYSFYITAGKAMEFRLRDFSAGASYQYAQVNTATVNSLIVDKKWHHIACTYNGVGGASAKSGMKIYIDGVDRTTGRINSGPAYTAMENRTTDLYFMSSIAIYDNISGSLNEMGLWTKELVPSEIKDVYNSGCPIDLTKIASAGGSLSSYWKLGDGDTIGGAGSIKDSKGSNDAQPLNTPTITNRDKGAQCFGAADTKRNCLWWDERAEKSILALSSSVEGVNANKQTFFDSAINETNAGAPILGSTSSAGIATYAGSTYATRRLAKPLRLKVDESPLVKGGVNEFVNKQTDLLTFIKHSTSGSYMKVKKSDVKDFKKCTDDVAPNNGKKKHNFESAVTSFKLTDVDKSYLTSKGDLYAFFDIYSASVAGGYHDNVAANFKAGIDITNLHEDTYGPMYGRPVQGPFTEKFVGGKVYRHINSNLRSHNKSPDTAANRIEGWRIMFSASSLYAFGSGYNNNMIANPFLQKGSMFRSVMAKRPVNIENIKMFIGSTSPVPGYPGQVLDATNIGNYSHNYDFVMTNGRTINNRYLAEAGTLPTTYSPSTYVSGLIDFAVPRRDLTGSTHSIIVNRFASPGSPATMGDGTLDLAAGEYSVYNALPWRNLDVRVFLNEWYTDHAKQFGYFSDYQTLAAYQTAGETYVGGSGSVNASNYSGTASYHKVNRNSKKKIFYTSATSTSSYSIKSVHDNWFVQHQIPQTDLQYAWITASVINGYTGSALYGFEQPNYSNASLASTDITFCSASNFGSTRVTAGTGAGRWWGYTPKEVASAALLADIIFTDFAGLNINIYEPITASQNSLGYPRASATADSSGFYHLNYLSSFITSSNPLYGNATSQGITALLNGIILNRQGPYGWPSWKQIRGAQHPVMRHNYKNNIQTFTKLLSSNVDGAFAGFNNEIAYQVEPPITSKFSPLQYEYSYKSDVPNAAPSEPINMWSSYGNEKAYFTNVPDYNISRLIDLNNSNLVWSKAGQTEQSLQAADNKILAYDTLKKYLLWNTPSYVGGDANPIDDFYNMKISEGIYPREHFTYRKLVRERMHYLNNFWRGAVVGEYAWGKSVGSDGVWKWYVSRRKRNLKTTNSQGYVNTNYTAFWNTSSIWSLDSDVKKRLLPGRELYSSGSEGELQNSYSIWHGSTGSSAGLIEPIAAATYNRRVPTAIDASNYCFLGQTEWWAAKQAGFPPSYNTYADYVEDVKRIGKDYGIIPEYRVSEHVKYHVVDKASEGQFLAPNPGWLTLTGAAINKSDQNPLEGSGSFYTVYTNSDFLKYFEPIDSDFSQVAQPTKLTLKCNAIMKFLPYDGFYPSERAVQLATLFSQSYAPNASLNGTQKNWRTLLTPFFAPGILFNSIKSGMAVDYPIFTSAVKNYLKPHPVAVKEFVAVATDPPDKRVPFEALAEPLLFINDIGTIVDAETHRSASIDSTGSFGKPKHSLYSRAMNNFLSEVPRFFLGGTDSNAGGNYGPMTTFVSKATPEGAASDLGAIDPEQMISFEVGKTYKMRIVCSHSEVRDLSTIHNINTTPGALRFRGSASYTYNPPTIMMYNRAFDRTHQTKYAALTSSVGIIPWTLNAHYMGGNAYTTYIPAYGSSFGPPVYAGGFTYYDAGVAWSGSATGSFEPYTPPYYNGYSHIELSYTPDFGGYKTITDVISEISATYYREMLTTGTMDDPDWPSNSFPLGSGKNAARKSAMQLSASINWNKVVTKDGLTRWVIQPKWECPVLDFTNSPAAVAGAGALSSQLNTTSKGMWHQFGSIPGADSGVFLEIQAVSGSQDDDLVGNLAEKLGFDVEPSKKLGQIPNAGKTIYEAIVAVPFYEDYSGKRAFFHIDRKTIDWAESKLTNPEIKDIDYAAANLANVPNGAKLKPGASVVNMVKSMKKFVIPPSFNFLSNKDQEPMAMAIFEFSHQFTQDDLVKMWQGILPSQPRTDAASGVQAVAAEIDLGINLKEAKVWKSDSSGGGAAPAPPPAEDILDDSKGFDLLNDIPGSKKGAPGIGFPKNIQWMVFKVKQKASWSYKDIVIPGSDAPDQAYSYSYNWPYDFFSLIELAKINETITMEPVGPAPNAPTVLDMLGMLPFTTPMWVVPPVNDSVTQTDPSVFEKIFEKKKFGMEQFVFFQSAVDSDAGRDF